MVGIPLFRVHILGSVRYVELLIAAARAAHL